MIRLLFTLFLVFSGCSLSSSLGSVPKEALETEATLAPVTKTEQMLRSLPAPRAPVAVAVYEFVDYTGQNKPAEIPQYSRAVTQGGLAMLKKALLDAGNHHWFRVVERGGINNLLNERKIIRSMRTEYLSADGRRLPPLAPLTYAGVILEGGITSYESNVASGGLGARYLGIGGSTKYSRDMVTVYLRAVSVTTGEVLLSVSTSKTVFSIGLSGGLFKFVAYDKITEGEAGVTYNEPPQLAVRQAIELAVYSLIMEGCKSKFWSMTDPSKQVMVYDNYQHQFKEDGSPTPAQPSVMLAGPSAPQPAPALQLVQSTPPPPASKEVKAPAPIQKPVEVARSSTPRILADNEERRTVSVGTNKASAWYILVSLPDSRQGGKVLRELVSEGFSAQQYCDDGSCSVIVGPYATPHLATAVRGSFKVFDELGARVVHQ